MSNSVKRRRPIWQRVLLALVAIIALYLILKSDMEILKGYIESYIKGANAG